MCMRKLEHTSEKKTFVFVTLEWDLRALHAVPHYDNLFVRASVRHHFPAHECKMKVEFFSFILRMSLLLALNTEIQQLLRGMSLKSTQHNGALICDEFVKKKVNFP